MFRFRYENNDEYDDSVSHTILGHLILILSLGTAGATANDMLPIFPKSDDISQFNAWLSYQTGGLTLAAGGIFGIFMLSICGT